MLKILHTIFSNPKDAEKMEESTVAVTLATPVPNKQEIVDDAVREVVRKTLTRIIREQLVMNCYSAEEIRQTALARSMWADRAIYARSHEALELLIFEIKEKYPESIARPRGHVGPPIYEHLPFDLERFISRILDKAEREEAYDE